MKLDSSKYFYDKYYKLNNRNVQFVLRNNEVLNAQIIGFYKGIKEFDEPYIIKWHLLHKSNKNCLGIDAFGFYDGLIIHHSEIISTKFEEDNFIIKFN